MIYQLTEFVDGLAEKLCALLHLTSLDLEGNNIGVVGAASLAVLPEITSLYLKNNGIGAVGAASLATLPRLTELDLGGNKIGDAGAGSLAALTQLTSLSLGCNKLRDIGASSLTALTQLVKLDLGGSNVGDTGAASLAALSQLTTLGLQNNSIGNAGAASLAALSRLANLDLSGNPISSAAPFPKCYYLKYLNLANTKLQDLSPLRLLLEQGLEVKCEESEFHPSTSQGINVCGCPLIHPPPEIIQQGQEAVLSYLCEIDKQGVDHLHEAKVLILGDGSVGKTSLLRRLYRTDLPLPKEEESTRRIDIHRHEFANAEGRPFRLNVWDFGGQQIYHATHQLFLTKRSLYILVDDTRNSSRAVHDEPFKYWLEMIEALSDASPVLIFQNEKGGRPKRIDEAGIKGRFPNVLAVHRGNLDHPAAANELAAAIRYHVQGLPHVGEAVPARWLAIRSELEQRKQTEPFITLTEYLQLYGRHLEYDESKALQLSRYLHDLGVFLHFQEDLRLERLVILKNDWATEAVFKMLDDRLVIANSGYFYRQDCKRIWADSTYAGRHLELLALMEKFELCYKLPDQKRDTWLLPQLLSPSAPEGAATRPQPEDLVLTYQYNFLPLRSEDRAARPRAGAQTSAERDRQRSGRPQRQLRGPEG